MLSDDGLFSSLDGALRCIRPSGCVALLLWSTAARDGPRAGSESGWEFRLLAVLVSPLCV